MKLYKDKDWLYEKYWKEKKVVQELADECKCTWKTIARWMNKYNIKRRNPSERQKEIYKKWRKEKYITRESLEKKLEIKSVSEIANECNCCFQTVYGWLHYHKITKIPRKKYDLYKSKSWLYNKYWIEKKSSTEIAKEIGSCPGTVLKWLSQYDINIRTISDSLKGKKKSKEHVQKIREVKKGVKNPKLSDTLSKKNISGYKNPNWRGGKFPYYGISWYTARSKALKRAGYASEISRECKEILVVHHIIPRRVFVDKYIELCLKPHIPYFERRILRTFCCDCFIPELVFNEANNLKNLIVVTDTEHPKIEGQLLSFFESKLEGINKNLR